MKSKHQLTLLHIRFGTLWIPFFLLLVTLIGTTGCEDHRDLPQSQISPFASGLVAPLGVETDPKGQVWVTQAGSGTASDGQLSVITPQGQVFPVVTGFVSQVSPEGAVFGLNHLLLQGTTLYLLHGVEGRLYKFDISQFQPGNAPVPAQSLAYEAVGDFVKAYSFADDTDETDLFNLTTGPEGDLFIVDAAANAIIRRNATTHALSVFATIPPIINPGVGTPGVGTPGVGTPGVGTPGVGTPGVGTPGVGTPGVGTPGVGTPGVDTLEAVPTGIVFDGQRFLVSNFTGFPFPSQRATIYQYDLQGNESTYQTGLTTMTDIELDENRQPIVLEYGIWTGQGFVDNSGTVVRSSAQGNTFLLRGINYPNSIKRSGPNTYYVAQTFDGIIQKITL